MMTFWTFLEFLPCKINIKICLTSDNAHSVSLLLTTSSSSLFMLEVSTLSSSLLPDKSHYLHISFYRDAKGTVLMFQLYIKAFLCDNFRIDNSKILDTT